MRGIRWHGRRDVRYETDVADSPEPSAGRIRIDVEWCGICGTDVEEYVAGPIIVQGPVVLGHEFVGRVVDLGDDVDGIVAGDLVALDGHDPCGNCDQCTAGRPQLCRSGKAQGFNADGGLAEQVTVSAASAVVVPPGVAADHVALAEPTSVGVRALRRGRLAAGERVTIVGAGAVGLLAAQVARAMGASSVAVVDPVEERRRVALDLAVDEAVAPGTAIDPAAVVLDCTGQPDVPMSAVDLVEHGGRIVLVGLPTEPATVRWLPLVFREAELIGMAGHAYDLDFTVAVDHLVAGRVRTAPIVSHRLPLDRALDEGLLAMVERRPGLHKVLARP